MQSQMTAQNLVITITTLAGGAVELQIGYKAVLLVTGGKRVVQRKA